MSTSKSARDDRGEKEGRVLLPLSLPLHTKATFLLPLGRRGRKGERRRRKRKLFFALFAQSFFFSPSFLLSKVSTTWERPFSSSASFLLSSVVSSSSRRLTPKRKRKEGERLLQMKKFLLSSPPPSSKQGSEAFVCLPFPSFFHKLHRSPFFLLPIYSGRGKRREGLDFLLFLPPHHFSPTHPRRIWISLRPPFPPSCFSSALPPSPYPVRGRRRRACSGSCLFLFLL